MSGMKAAAADPMLHIGLLVGVCLLPRDQHCESMGKSARGVILLLIGNHAFNAARFFVSIFLT